LLTSLVHGELERSDISEDGLCWRVPDPLATRMAIGSGGETNVMRVSRDRADGAVGVGTSAYRI